MQRRDLYSVLLKTLGTWQFVTGLQMVPFYFGQYLRWDNPDEFAERMLAGMLSDSGIRLVTGVVLFIAADWLARWVYAESAQTA